MGFFSRSYSFDIYLVMMVIFIIIALFAMERVMAFGRDIPRARQATMVFVIVAAVTFVFTIIFFNPFAWRDNSFQWQEMFGRRFTEACNKCSADSCQIIAKDNLVGGDMVCVNEAAKTKCPLSDFYQKGAAFAGLKYNYDQGYQRDCSFLLKKQVKTK